MRKECDIYRSKQAFRLVITCEDCEKVYINSCPLINDTYDVNRRIIFAMSLLGISLNGISKFCAFINLPRFINHVMIFYRQ